MAGASTDAFSDLGSPAAGATRALRSQRGLHTPRAMSFSRSLPVDRLPETRSSRRLLGRLARHRPRRGTWLAALLGHGKGGVIVESMLDPSELGTDRIRPLRRAEYDRLVDAGCFDEDGHL